MTDTIIAQKDVSANFLGKKKPKKFKVDRDWFYQKYIVEKTPTYLIAQEIGCVDVHISALADKFEIPRRGRLPRSIPHQKQHILDIDEVKRLYLEERMACADIGRIFGCSSKPVSDRLKEAGVKLRHHNDTKRGRPARNKIYLNPDVIREMYNIQYNSAQTVADHFGVSRQVIDRIMHEHGIEKKSISETRDFWGDKSPNWKPELSDEERLNRRDMYQQKVWREKVYERDGYTCKCCGDDRGGNLHAHHITPHSANKSIAWEVWNGLTMCKRCHIDFHIEYGYTRCTSDDLFAYILQRM